MTQSELERCSETEGMCDRWQGVMKERREPGMKKTD